MPRTRKARKETKKTSSPQEKGLDPDDSSLDEVWTIEIEPLPLNIDGDVPTKRIRQTKATYQVPKRLLACGERKCQYFATLFANDNFAEAQSRTSRIQLHKHAFKAFPAMLDFIGGDPKSELTITTESAVALYHLGGYFDDNKALRNKAEQFWRKDVVQQPYEMLHIYYEHAKCFHEDAVLDALKDRMGLFLHSLTFDEPDSLPPIITKGNPEFWLSVFQKHSEGEDMDVLSCTKGMIIVKCLNVHKESAGKDVFNDLTTDTILPMIDELTAFDLLEHEASIVGPTDGNGLSSLQQRCVDGIAHCWDGNLSTADAQEAHGLLRSGVFSPSLMKEIMLRSLKNMYEI